MKLTAADIARATGVTDRAIRARANKEAWGKELARNPRGGAPVTQYTLDTLPEPVQMAVMTHQAQETLPAPSVPAAPTKGLCAAQEQNALAKASLLKLYTEYVAKAIRGKKTTAREAFVQAYNSGIPYPELFQRLGPVSWKTIEGWKQRAKKTGDILHLSDGRGYARRGQTVITNQQAAILIQCALSPNAPLVSEVIRAAQGIMAVKGIPNGHSTATYRRWLQKFREQYFDIWTFAREGATAWNDKVAYYIERDTNLLQVGDVLVADGHTLNFEVINPATGKPKRMTLLLWQDMKSSMPLGWELMATENTQCINSALRRAILALGKMPRVAYLDNGRAFRARFFEGCADFEEKGFTGLYERLGIKTIHAWPYHGQSKVVERFFRDFSELERKALTYCGTSITTQPPRMHRGERLHRQMWDKVSGGQVITLEQAHQAIAAWFEEYGNRPKTKGHLAGLRPIDVFMEGRGPGVDPATLHHLMMAHKITHIHRNGITFNKQHYYAPELYGYRGQAVIRYDLADPSYIIVYEPHNLTTPMCTALPVEKIHPAAHALGTEADQAALTHAITFKKSQEKQAASITRAILEHDVLPQVRHQAETLGMGGAVPAVSDAPRKLPAPKKLTQADADQVLAEVAELEAYQAQAADTWAGMPGLSDMDKYERIAEAETRGLLIPKQWQAFARYYEATDEYARDQQYWEQFRAKTALNF